MSHAEGARSAAGDERTAPASLRITEIFLSLQGESTRTGLPTVFVRTTGCPLRCRYCDTAYAFTGGRVMTLDAIVAQVTGYGVGHVCVTGGEPLAQPGVLALMSRLCDADLAVSLETSGAISLDGIDERVMKVVDIKTPGSGESARNLEGIETQLSARDQFKFVITDRADYEWSRDWLHAYGGSAEVLFSPSAGELAPATLAGWILDDRLPVRFQTQLHKQLWGDVPGR